MKHLSCMIPNELPGGNISLIKTSWVLDLSTTRTLPGGSIQTHRAAWLYLRHQNYRWQVAKQFS